MHSTEAAAPRCAPGTPRRLRRPRCRARAGAARHRQYAGTRASVNLDTVRRAGRARSRARRDCPGWHRLQMMLNFAVNQRLFYALATADTEPLVWALEQTFKRPANAQWVQFLRSHDELDLGRLDPEQREKVFKAFAPSKRMQLYNRGIRRRLAPMLGNNRQRLELAYSLLFSLPGTPMMQYGDEIGMGDNLRLPERECARTPMQWTSERHGGFSRARRVVRPAIDDPVYGYEKVNPPQLLQPRAEGAAARRRAAQRGARRSVRRPAQPPAERRAAPHHARRVRVAVVSRRRARQRPRSQRPVGAAPRPAERAGSRRTLIYSNLPHRLDGANRRRWNARDFSSGGGARALARDAGSGPGRLGQLQVPRGRLRGELPRQAEGRDHDLDVAVPLQPASQGLQRDARTRALLRHHRRLPRAAQDGRGTLEAVPGWRGDLHRDAGRPPRRHHRLRLLEDGRARRADLRGPEVRPAPGREGHRHEPAVRAGRRGPLHAADQR